MRGLGLVPRLAVLGIKNSKSKPRSSWVNVMNVDNMCIKRQTELARPGAVFNQKPFPGAVFNGFLAPFKPKTDFPNST
jgi:hypothetical protein